MPEHVGIDDGARRQRLLDLGDRLVDACSQRQGVGVRLLLYQHDHRGLRVGRAVPELDRWTDGDLSQIADEYGRVVPRCDDGLGDLLDAPHASCASDQVLLSAVHVHPAGEIDVAAPGGAQNLVQRYLVSGQFLGQNVDLVLLDVAADGDDLRNPGHRQQASPHGPVGQGSEIHHADPGSVLRRQADDHDLAHDG